LITAGDIPGRNELADFPVPVLASGELSYQGEPAALLVGPDRVKLESYAARCRIVVQEEEPVFAAPASAGGESPAEPESFAERGLSRGDIEAAFNGAALVVGASYTTGIQEHGYSEAVGALAEYNGGRWAAAGGKKDEAGAVQPLLVIHSATQWPYHVRRSAARVLGLEEDQQVIVEATDPGIPMDGKIWYPSLIGCQAALAAFITRRHVRLLLNREEDFRFSPKRNASVVRIQSALGEGGEILGTKIDLQVDLGAQAVFCQEILDQSCLGVLGIAEEGALSLRARAVKTNIPPQGPFGGFGGAQGGFAMERHCSLIADSLETDPAEWRKDQCSRGKGAPRSGRTMDQNPPAAWILDAAAAMGDYYRKWGSYELLRRKRREESPPARPENLRGIGIALGRQGNGFLHICESGFTMEITLNIDGSLEIRSSAKAGKDLIAIWSNIARETLGVEEDKVRVLSRNTALCPDSGPESLSRNICSLSSLVERSCQTIRNQRFRDPLPITVRETPDLGGGGSDMIRPLMTVPNPESQGRPGRAAAVVEVEIEPSSYSPVIRGVWIAVDGGRIFSESRARRSLKLAAVQALGWASSERLEYRGGLIEPGVIADYGVSGPADIPPIRVDFLWNDAVLPKGIGELPFCCVPAAYIQAVSQALDHPFKSIPLRPEDIWGILNPGPGPAESGGAEQEAAK
jgi:CO/xanthine dehydrogenase Mo-binding subunit